MWLFLGCQMKKQKWEKNLTLDCNFYETEFFLCFFLSDFQVAAQHCVWYGECGESTSVPGKKYNCNDTGPPRPLEPEGYDVLAVLFLLVFNLVLLKRFLQHSFVPHFKLAQLENNFILLGKISGCRSLHFGTLHKNIWMLEIHIALLLIKTPGKYSSLFSYGFLIFIFYYKNHCIPASFTKKNHPLCLCLGNMSRIQLRKPKPLLWREPAEDSLREFASAPAVSLSVSSSYSSAVLYYLMKHMTSFVNTGSRLFTPPPPLLPLPICCSKATAASLPALVLHDKQSGRNVLQDVTCLCNLQRSTHMLIFITFNM